MGIHVLSVPTVSVKATRSQITWSRSFMSCTSIPALPSSRYDRVSARRRGPEGRAKKRETRTVGLAILLRGHPSQKSSQGSLCVGGKTKYSRNVKTVVPFTLVDQESRFWAVVESLRECCFDHTISFDEKQSVTVSVPRHRFSPRLEA